MKHTVTLLGQEIGFEGPSTAEEFDALAGAGRCLHLAMRDILYRPVGSAFRKGVCKWLEDNTGNKRRKTGTKVTGTGAKKKEVDVFETDEVYHDRLVAEGATISDGSLDAKATIAAAYKAGVEAVGDLSVLIKELGSSRSEVAQQWVNRAEATLAKWENGESTREIFITRVREVLPEATLSDDPSVLELAKLIKQYMENCI